LIKGVKQKRSEAPLAMLGTLSQIAIQHDFVEAALGEILGLFVVTAFATQVAIDRFPVSVEEKADQRAISVAARLDAIDQGPVGGQECSSSSTHICVVALLHSLQT
jgi:hypothetical protein